MNKLKRVVLSIFIITMLICPAWAFAQDGGDIVIIYTNDTHCSIDGEIGFADISALKALELEKGNEVILLDAGDAVQGGMVGAISKGSYIVDIMNAVGYDMAVLGNHEFDYGVPRMKELVKMAKYPYLSANFKTVADDKPVLDPYKLITANGKKIAFIGATTPNTYTSSSPKYFQDEKGNYIYDFGDVETFYSSINQMITKAYEDNADFIIAVTHVGDNAAEGAYTSYDIILNCPGLDAVIDGHSHSVIEGTIERDLSGHGVLLTSTGAHFENIGMMTISSDGNISSKLINASYKAEGLSDKAKAAYDATQTVIDAIKAKYTDEFSKVVATTKYDLTIMDPNKYTEENGTYREVRRGETNLADFVADAYRAVAETDIAFVNGGNVRVDIPKGNVTFGDLLNVNPFGNNLCVIEATGQQIVDALEHGAKSYPAEDGGFLHASGLTYDINGAIDSSVVLDDKGRFIEVAGEYRVRNVKVDGQPIDLAKKYTFCGNDYSFVNEGDGFTMFNGANLVNASVCGDVEALIKYTTDILGGKIGDEYMYPYGQGRIKIVSEPAAAVEYKFVDTISHWAKDSIARAASMGIVNGESATKFNPNAKASRAMFVTMLYRLDNSPKVEGTNNFTDVKAGQYYENAVVWASENNIVTGFANGTFAPNDFITREQMTAMLYRYAQYKGLDVSVGEDTNILSYDDIAKVHEYAIPALQWACGAQVVNGISDSLLAPLDNATRAQVTTTVLRLLDLEAK